jgi:hypothetical protein
MGNPTLFERELIYWCVVRGFADASAEKYTDKTPEEITIFQVMWFLRDKRK